MHKNHCICTFHLSIYGCTICQLNVMLDSGQLAPCYKNTMSSTKPKVHNILQCHRRTEPRPYATLIKNLAKIGLVVFELCEQTDKRTYSSKYSVPLWHEDMIGGPMWHTVCLFPPSFYQYQTPLFGDTATRWKTQLRFLHSDDLAS